MANSARTEDWASAPPDRVADRHQAFADDDVGIVLAGIGGNHANQLLPLLDFDLIHDHPKVFQSHQTLRSSTGRSRRKRPGSPCWQTSRWGHTDLMLTLPFGVEAEIDSLTKTLTVEAATAGDVTS